MDFNNFEGKITINEEEKYFYYNNKSLTVFSRNIKDEWKDNIDLYNKKEFILLEAITIDNYSVTFVNITLIYYGKGIYKAYVPAMFISTTNNYILPYADNFFKISFKGECINKLFKTSNIGNLEQNNVNLFKERFIK